jgi:hypothetical protein
MASAIHWWPEPAAGDLVWCHFPDDLDLTLGSKPRPALILTVFDDDAPCYRVRVAYGTSQKTRKLYSGEFIIADTDRSVFKLSGLSYTTKFNLGRIVELPYNDEWFSVPPAIPYGQMPKLGLLHPSLTQKVRAAWSAVSRAANLKR